MTQVKNKVSLKTEFNGVLLVGFFVLIALALVAVGHGMFFQFLSMFGI